MNAISVWSARDPIKKRAWIVLSCSYSSRLKRSGLSKGIDKSRSFVIAFQPNTHSIQQALLGVDFFPEWSQIECCSTLSSNWIELFCNWSRAPNERQQLFEDRIGLFKLYRFHRRSQTLSGDKMSLKEGYRLSITIQHIAQDLSNQVVCSILLYLIAFVTAKPIRFKEIFPEPMKINHSVLIFTGSKTKHTIGSGTAFNLYRRL